MNKILRQFAFHSWVLGVESMAGAHLIRIKGVIVNVR